MQNILPRYKNKNVLVTGGTGFIGLNLVRFLKRAGANVTVIFFADAKLNKDERDILGGVKVKALDIRDKSGVGRQVLQKDFIFHLAAHSGAVDSMKNPILDMEVNCAGTLNLLEGCRYFNKKTVILSLGSRLQFGRPEYLPVDESHPFMPTSIHAINKIAVENFFLLYHRTFNLNTIYFRVTNPYGPYQRKESKNFGIVNFFIHKALSGEPIKIFGTGRQLRDYIYIDDLVEVMLRAPLIKRAYGEVFNIGSGKAVELLDMVKKIIDVTGRGSFKKIPWPKEFKKVETGDFVADIAKAKKILRWKPGTGIEQGLRKTLQAYL